MPKDLGTTTLAESSQALICALADLVGAGEFNKFFAGNEVKNELMTYKRLKDKLSTQKLRKAFERIEIGPINLSVLEKFLKDDPSWYESSMKIAREMINQIKTIDKDFDFDAPGFQNMFYFRGDDDLMGTIASLFKSANKQSSSRDDMNGQKQFGDINKWSPADMYFGTKKALKDLQALNDDTETKKNKLTFAQLNTLFLDLIDTGDLLPLSLKKVEKEKVIIEKVNFKRSAEEKKLANFELTGVEEYKPMSVDYKLKRGSPPRFVFLNCKDGEIYDKKTSGRDIYLTYKIKGGKPGRIQFRHTPFASGKPSKGMKVVVSITGTSALAGQVTSITQLVNAIKEADDGFAREVQSTFDTIYQKYHNKALEYLKYGGGDKLQKFPPKSPQRNEFDRDVGAISGKELMNPFRKFLKKYFSKTQSKKVQNVGRAIFGYATSRSKQSGPFVIAKD